MRASELELDLGTVTMNCTTDEVAATLAALLREMRSVIPRLRQDERETLRRIMSHESNTLTVADAFPGFARESEGHKTLRRLRAAQFVRPARTGRWDPGERIEVKPFARLMWDRVGEDVIFAGRPGSAAAREPVPVAAPADDVVDLGGAEEPGVPETAPAVAEPAADVDDVVLDLRDVEEAKGDEDLAVAKKSAGAFEDDSVLDPGGDDLFAFAQEELGRKP
jgi:hypothetical protein